MQHQPARLNSSCPRGRPCQEGLGQGQEQQLAVAVRQDTALHLAQGPSRQAAGAAGAAVAAGASGAAVAAGTAVAADKGHEHLHHRCPNHQCIGRHRPNHHDHHHQGLRDTSPCHDDHAPPGGQEGPSSAQSSMPSASQVPTCKLGPSGARMVSMSSLALAQMPRQEAPSYSCSRSPGPQ